MIPASLQSENYKTSTKPQTSSLQHKPQRKKNYDFGMQFTADVVSGSDCHLGLGFGAGTTTRGGIEVRVESED